MSLVRDSRARRRSSCTAYETANTARLANGCRFVCCDDCSTKRELLDVILRVPYVDEFRREQNATSDNGRRRRASSMRVRVRVRASVSRLRSSFLCLCRC